MDDKSFLLTKYQYTLNDIIGNSIEDLLIPSLGVTTVDTISQVITATAYCLVYGGGKQIYFHAIEHVIGNENHMSIELLDSLMLRRYPAGPNVGWESIFHHFMSYGMVVSTINILHSNTNDDTCHSELISGVILNTDGWSFGFIPSSFPLWINLVFNRECIIELLTKNEC